MKRHFARLRNLRARMKNLFSQLDQHSEAERAKSRQRTDFRPAFEPLELRMLMAVDVGGGLGGMNSLSLAASDGAAIQLGQLPGPMHNSFDAEDVNGDGECTTIDVVKVINSLNSGLTDTVNFTDVNGDGECTPLDMVQVINRLNAGPGWGSHHWPPNPGGQPVLTGEARSIDGTGNNVTNTTWGSTGVDLLRTAPAAYGDGISSPAGDDRPSAREISNTVSDQGDEEILNSRQLSAMAYAWGQFIDHDMDLTPTAGTEVLKIDVPTGDPSFDPAGTGTQGIYTSRSVYDAATGTSIGNPRQQINTITAWLDGSMVYGSDATTAAELRTMSGGLLKTSSGNLLPLNDPAVLGGPSLKMANDAQIVPETDLFAAGDVRANENVELTSLQTLFVREHNYWAGKIAATKPSLTDEQIYQQARAIVIAEIQSITYNQWLPALLGNRAIASYRGYNPTVNPGIANEFSTAAFRFGHSIVGNDVKFLNNNGDPTQDELPLAFAFFNPDVIKGDGTNKGSGIDPLLKYLASDVSEEMDTKVVDSLRNFLFGPPGAGGLDLASLNIERGRDNGIADYNTARAAYGLPKVTSFDQITSDPDLAAKLQSLYGSVDNIDLWVGGLAEDHVRGGGMGPTFTAIIADQFQRLRDGDRFWFERTFSGRQLTQLENTTLADIIQRNTGVTGLQDNVFFFRSEAAGSVYFDVNGNGVLDSRSERGISGVTLQLLDEDNNVVATAVTGRDGRYRLGGFSETGDYHVQIVLPSGATLTTGGLLDFHISSGNQSIRGLNFGLSLLLKPGTSGGSSSHASADWAAGVDAYLASGQKP